MNIANTLNPLDRGWEKFKGGPTRTRADILYVTINSKGAINMNRRAHQALGEPAAVAVYYNREIDSIALEPAFERSNESFPVAEHQGRFNIRISPFCRHHNIKVPMTVRFVRPEIRDGRLILGLRETVTTGGIAAKRGRTDVLE